jgi:thiamine pyrophosphate-dependent acetolactate synthase large subunit-like protein
MNGARQVAETLHRLGVETVFSVSGVQILPLFDALPEANVKIVHARHENAAVYMAEAWGQLRGQPGICLLTAGPGVTSAVTAVANAQASESPILLLSGASPISQRGLGAFQEMDQLGLLGPFCKAAWSVNMPHGLGTAVQKAWRLAVTAVPGPVYLSLPVDVLESAEGSEAECHSEPPAVNLEIQRACRSDVQRIVDHLTRARRPAVMARPALQRGGSLTLLGRLQRRVATLVVESPRGLRDPLWGERRDSLKEADVVLLLGSQDFAVGFGPRGGKDCVLLQVTSTPAKPHDTATGHQVNPAPKIRLEADEAQFLADMLPFLESALPERAPVTVTAPTCPLDGGPLHPLAIAEEVRRILEPDDLLVVDGGEFGQWMRAGFRDLPNRQLVNGKLGAIGNSIPQAVGAALANPGRRVFAFLGDGTFSYHAAELDTAVRERLSLTVVIGNDSCYGAEWHIQAARYGPARTYATALERREYERVAEGYGAVGLAAEDRAELRRVLGTAVHTPPPCVACINVHIRSLPSAAAGA